MKMKIPTRLIRNIAITATLVGLVATLAAQSAARTGAVSVKSMPPSVVKTVPPSGDTAVDAALGAISVTFSKDMKTDRMWSFCQISNETFPQKAGEVHYLSDKRTCVMPVKLEPGKTYVIWINRGQYNSFRDTANNPAVPYLLVFETKK
ncbi:MAG TPA: Ig-like domain-containing protein [Verrucomicrobiota bacterium]|jgi:RNA polymerase sigma-70 factor (ECF subfamily)|nr:Ig-like domain-containing protein [Verrucomicrobiota bacterium]